MTSRRAILRPRPRAWCRPLAACRGRLALAVGAALFLVVGPAWAADEAAVPASVIAPPQSGPAPAAPPASDPPVTPVAATDPMPVIAEPPAPEAPPASLPGGPLVAPTVASTAEEAPLRVARPRFAIAAAIGVSVDNTGIADGRNVAVPSFSVQGGIGQDRLGFEARLFASEAAGQFSTPSQVATDRRAQVADVGADRQAVDLMLAVRPFARWQRQRLDWPARFVRALTVDVGVAGERVSIGAQTLLRVGAVVAAYADLPLTPAEDTSALHVRVAVRRMVGTRGDVMTSGTMERVGDTSADVLAGLAVIF